MKKIKVDRICSSSISKIIGLMFSRKRTILLKFKQNQKISLHNFFVFFSLNLYFLDRRNKVIEIKKRFLPFTFYTSKKQAVSVVESPFDLKLKIGQRILLSKNY